MKYPGDPQIFIDEFRKNFAKNLKLLHEKTKKFLVLPPEREKIKY